MGSDKRLIAWKPHLLPCQQRAAYICGTLSLSSPKAELGGLNLAWICVQNEPIKHLPCSPFFFCFFFSLLFSDEDAKAESSSEDKAPDMVHAQSQDQPQQASQPEASSGSSQLSGFGNLRKLEQPDLADRSSQSSFTSQDGTGNPLQKGCISSFRYSWLCVGCKINRTDEGVTPHSL